MQKNDDFNAGKRAGRLKLALLKMKLLICLFIIGCSTAFASTNAQVAVSVSVKNATLEKIFEEISQKTGYHFAYSVSTLKRINRMDLDVKNKDLKEVLELCLEGTGLGYKIEDEVVIISPRFVNNPQENMVEIRGIVRESDGEPLPGATILLKGSSTGVTSGSDGRFVIRVPRQDNLILSISFVGKSTREIKYTGQESVEVTMEEAEMSVNEVIVTGYQVVDKRESASSVFTIAGEEVIQSNALSLDNMLQGKVPGMMVLNSTSTPGAATKVRIRGTSSISGNREPLWVVDGIILDDPVPISTEELNDLDNVNLIGNAISGVNPMDIESINILKDASATAIYGVRAANGVIVVTTKRGKEGEPTVNYSGTFSITNRPSYRQLKRMNSKERIDVSKEIEERGLTYRFKPARVGYEGLLYDLYERNITANQFLEEVSILESNNTDWFDLLFRNAFTHKHNLSISGGTSKLNYYFSMAYTGAESNVRKNKVEQYNAMLKMAYNLRPELKINVQLMADLGDKDYHHTSINAYRYAYETSRALPAYNEDGSYAYYAKEQGSNNNPLLFNIFNEIANSGRKVKNDNIRFNTQVEWRVIDGLRLTGTLGINNSNTSDKNWYDEKSYAAARLRRTNYRDPLPDNDIFKNEQCKLPYGGQLKYSTTRNFSYTLRFQADYSKIWNDDHNATFVAGMEARSTKYEGNSSVRWGYLPERGETFVEIDPAIWTYYYKQSLKPNPDVVTNRLSNFLSFYGVASYSYQRKYIFNANIRADASNKFGQDPSTRFLPIWSVSARWNIQNEPWLRQAEWLNELSLKSSYGIQGNVSDDQTPRMIMQVGSLETVSNEYMNTLSKLPNPNLKWEKTRSFNIALDFSILNNRISGSVEYYHKKGNDQIVSIDVTPTVGVTSLSANVGDIVNKGYEVLFNAVPVRKKDFTWSFHINGGQNINRVTRGNMTKYTYAQYIKGTAIMEGYAINSFFSYKFDGLDESGLPEFKDLELVSPVTQEELLRQVLAYSGRRIPTIQGGFGNTFRYKDLTLNVFFSYSLGSKVRLNNLYSSTDQWLPNPDQNMSAEFTERWRKPGDESWAVIPTLSSSNLSMSKYYANDPQWGSTDLVIAANKWQMYNESDLRVVSGDFLRLRTLSLRYNMPQTISRKIGANNMGVRLEGNNLFVLHNKKLKGQDPEQLAFEGLGGGTTPPVSTFSLTLDVSF